MILRKYIQECTPYGGTTVFCVAYETDATTGPFIIYSVKIYNDLIALYRCLIKGKYTVCNDDSLHVLLGTGLHFFSTDPQCENQTTESMLGYISSVRGRETFRALYPSIFASSFRCRIRNFTRFIYRCYDHQNGVHFHSTDLACLPQYQDAGLLGYIK